MRDKRNNPLRLEGEAAIMEEINPKFFSYIVEWRNNPELNRYLNQPFTLTPELERKWYEDVYIGDDTQGFMVIIDKNTGIPIGTRGWTDMDEKKRRCVGGRLLLGDSRFPTVFLEGHLLLSDYLYQSVDVMYGHIVLENQRSIKFNSMLGYRVNEGEIQYPEKLIVNGQKIMEIYRTKKMYEEVRSRFMPFSHGNMNQRGSK